MVYNYNKRIHERILPKEEGISRKLQILYLRKQHEKIHRLIYTTFYIFLLSSPFFMIVLFKFLFNISVSLEIMRIFHIEGWVNLLSNFRDFFIWPYSIFIIFWQGLMIFLPIWVIIKIKIYINKKKELPKIYYNFLPKRFLIAELYPYPLGMASGLIFFYLAFMFLINLYENIVILVIVGGIIVISCIFSYFEVLKGRNTSYKRKYILGFIFYIFITFISYSLFYLVGIFL